MARCFGCGCGYADPDIGLCFECFCGPVEPPIPYPEPSTEDLCGGYTGHAEYEGSGRCYCGAETYTRPKAWCGL